MRRDLGNMFQHLTYDMQGEEGSTSGEGKEEEMTHNCSQHGWASVADSGHSGWHWQWQRRLICSPIFNEMNSSLTSKVS